MQGLCHYRTSEDYRLGWLWWLHKSMRDFCFFQRTPLNELLKWNVEWQERHFVQSYSDMQRGKLLKGQRSQQWTRNLLEPRTNYDTSPKNKDWSLFSRMRPLTSWLNCQIADNARKRPLWWDTLKAFGLSLVCILTSTNQVQLSTQESQRLNWPKLLIGCFASIIAILEGDHLHCTPH